MAQKTVVTMVDDLTGEEAENIGTVEFALDGVSYELDLSDENATKLRNALAQYTGAGRRTGGRRRAGRESSRTATSSGLTSSYNRETLKSIRGWAKQNGHSVSDRGRLSSEVLQAWETAHRSLV
ncbi:MAG: histone-like nucleoid-structuring protein Lsr2 [Pseudonocardiaceae bacterium]